MTYCEYTFYQKMKLCEWFEEKFEMHKFVIGRYFVILVCSRIFEASMWRFGGHLMEGYLGLHWVKKNMHNPLVSICFLSHSHSHLHFVLVLHLLAITLFAIPHCIPPQFHPSPHHIDCELTLIVYVLSTLQYLYETSRQRMIMLLHYILRQNTQLLDPLKFRKKKKKLLSSVK